MLLSDVGRVETARMVGPSTERVDGNVLAVTDTGYLVSVASVKPLRGAWVRWNGEAVTLRREHVAVLYERRLAKGRTALVAGGVAFLVLTAMVNLDILGFGALDIPIIPGADGDPGDQ
jgi:hypothetical protein